MERTTGGQRDEKTDRHTGRRTEWIQFNPTYLYGGRVLQKEEYRIHRYFSGNNFSKCTFCKERQSWWILLHISRPKQRRHEVSWSRIRQQTPDHGLYKTLLHQNLVSWRLFEMTAIVNTGERVTTTSRERAGVNTHTRALACLMSVFVCQKCVCVSACVHVCVCKRSDVACVWSYSFTNVSMAWQWR